MMLPTHLSRSGSEPPTFVPRIAAVAAVRSPSFLASFCHRMGHLSLMDLQFSLAQFSLLLFAPRKVYAFAVLRKKQKNHYARDDPGFFLLLLLFSVLVGLAYGLAFSHSLCGCLLTAVAPSIYLLLSGAVIAPLAYLLLLRHSNKTARTAVHHSLGKGIRTWADGRRTSSGHRGVSSAAQHQQEMPTRRDTYAHQQQPTGYFPLRLLQSAAERVPAGETSAAGSVVGAAGQRGNAGVIVGCDKTTGAGTFSVGAVPPVEIFFCFDVHWNAAFVYMVVGLVMQLFLFPVFSMLPDFLACVLANGLQLAAAGSYLFITVLGYMSVAATPPLPPVSALLPPVAAAAALVVLCAAFFHVNLAHASVKLLLMFETLALRPVVRNAGIAHALLQQEAFEFFSPNSSSNALSDARAPAAVESPAPVRSETGEAAIASATEAVLSAAAAGTGVGSAATHAGVPPTKVAVTRRPPAFSTAAAGVPAAGSAAGL